VEARLANLPRCRIGMEACVGAHHLSRTLKALGHDARLMPAKYVRPYSKGQKMASWNLVGCSTGKSAGFAPCSIIST
jgi:transposase